MPQEEKSIGPCSMALALSQFSRGIGNDVGIGAGLKKTETLEDKIEAEKKKKFRGIIHCRWLKPSPFPWNKEKKKKKELKLILKLTVFRPILIVFFSLEVGAISLL
ncbi:Hypothetical protein Minf_2151 [Methylacidiphilum infernorum V4]|uniref:Uncharacterized protein n=1 Tax=Methylacidiphilum infernorum (isolate V4) TaxID=481448 RepID=B3DZM0_METI4|nr:Hypothetical protein Minf_2151 [Methylacidiphilum infernorum V4]